MSSNAQPRVSIRPASPTDVPLILQLIEELAEYERAPESARATPADLHDALFATRPACECVIGEIDGVAHGFALFFHNFSTWEGKRGIYLEDLFVRPASRGVGLGKALFTHVARIALERGCPRFEWAVLDWNTPAIEFYQARGARAMDEWTVYRLEGDALRSAARAGR